MEEIWKDIPDYDGKYQISNLGRVKSLIFINRNIEKQREKIMKTQKHGNYLKIVLTKSGIKKNYLIHRLVAQAFILNPDNLPEVNHKDENALNNFANNLEWCDHKYNINYGTRTQKVLDKTSKKVRQLDLDKNVIKIWDSLNDAIRHYSNSHIFDVCHHQRKTASGYIWEYENS